MGEVNKKEQYMKSKKNPKKPNGPMQQSRDTTMPRTEERTDPMGSTAQVDMQGMDPGAATTEQRTFMIQRIFTKGVTFDAPQVSDVFGKDWKPQVNVNIQSNTAALPDNMHEVELTITIEAKMNDKTVFTINIKQAGIFIIQNFTKEQMDLILGSECLKILFPYAREAVTDLTSRATLPQFYLNPINFDSIYAQQMQQKASKQGN